MTKWTINCIIEHININRGSIFQYENCGVSNSVIYTGTSAYIMVLAQYSWALHNYLGQVELPELQMVNMENIYCHWYAGDDHCMWRFSGQQLVMVQHNVVQRHKDLFSCGSLETLECLDMDRPVPSPPTLGLSKICFESLSTLKTYCFHFVNLKHTDREFNI